MKTISEMVTDGQKVWLETQRFFGYSKRQAQKVFDNWIDTQGWWYV